MADFKEVVEQHKEALVGMEAHQEGFNSLTTKLNELGYDVLLNQKEKAEFIPSSRLSDVVSQRDTFKTQVQDLNKQMQAMKDAAKGNEALQSQLQGLMDTNNNLLVELENTKTNTALMLAAKDAVSPQDVLLFVNRDNLKANAKGEIMGLEAEIARIKTEKPYLFKTETQKKKGGSDSGSGDGDTGKGNMNFLIRRAAGQI